MEQNTNAKSWIFVVVALIIGAGGGYYFGFQKGESAYVASQQKAAQDAIIEAANPFADNTIASPIEGTYENPFDTNINPFK